MIVSCEGEHCRLVCNNMLLNKALDCSIRVIKCEPSRAIIDFEEVRLDATLAIRSTLGNLASTTD